VGRVVDSAIERRIWESWARGEVEAAVHAAVDGSVGDDPDHLVRLACVFALRRHRVDLLEPHEERIRALPVGVERDAVLATLKLGAGDLEGAIALVMAPTTEGGTSRDPRLPSDTALRAAAQTHIGLGALASGSWAAAEQCVEAARAALASAAWNPADEALRFDLLGMAAVIEAHTGAGDEAFRALDAALSPLRAQNRLTSDHALALIQLGDVQHLHGDLAAAAVNLTRGARLTPADRPGFSTHALVALAFIRVRQGRWADASASIAELRAAEATVEHEWLRTQVQAVQGLIHVVEGDFTQSAALLAGAQAGAQKTSSYIASIVVLHAQIVASIAAGDWRALERHLDDAEEPGYRHPYRMGEWNALRLLAAWHLGNHAQFRRRLTEWSLNPLAVTDPYYWAFAAILAEHQRRYDDGLTAVGRALEAIAPDHDPLGRGWVRIVAGTYLSRHGKHGGPDPLRALTVYDDACNELREIGAPVFVERCEQLSGAVAAELELARRTHPTAVLSEQQLRIASAVAHGYTSDEIASMEHLTKRTIDYHVTNILRRLGITSRREIARILASENDG
jgi:DNA-binding CsgD family transcriptional regulator